MVLYGVVWYGMEVMLGYISYGREWCGMQLMKCYLNFGKAGLYYMTIIK